MNRDRRSAEAEAYRRLYKSARWRALRAVHLDGHRFCYMCQQQGKTRLATIVDHHEPHKGDIAKFFDPSNLRSLCKPHHDRAKQKEERAGHQIGNDPDGRPLDPHHPWNRG